MNGIESTKYCFEEGPLKGRCLTVIGGMLRVPSEQGSIKYICDQESGDAYLSDEGRAIWNKVLEAREAKANG